MALEQIVEPFRYIVEGIAGIHLDAEKEKVELVRDRRGGFTGYESVQILPQDKTYKLLYFASLPAAQQTFAHQCSPPLIEELRAKVAHKADTTDERRYELVDIGAVGTIDDMRAALAFFTYAFLDKEKH